MTKDLRSFIAELEARSPDEVARVSQPISARYEITALLTQLEKKKRFPLLFCERVQGSDAPVVINAQASRRLMAVALECEPEDLARKFSERQAKPIPPVEMTNAPVHEVIQTGDEVDLSNIPILTHYDVNAAPYITAGIVVAVDPDTGVRNTSYNRLMMAGKRELRIFMAVGRHLWTLHDKLERRNQPLPIAIVIGVHPLFSLGAQAFTPATEDEYAVIGGMMGEPLQLVKARTVPIPVPADAEMIIEGQILPHVRRTEGPFGEFTGHAVSQDERQVIEVSAITHRKNYIFQDVHAGYTEHKLMGAVPREAALIKAVRQTVPTVKNVCMPVSGNCRFHAYISIAKRAPGQAKNAICAAFAADMLLKHVVIVDEDIDVFDEEQVLWAVSNRFQADKGLVVIANAQGSELDPSAGPGGVNTKMGLDATKPLDGFAPELRVPDEVMRKVRLEDFLPRFSK
ncbi:MAG: UbiD family decarboxylase [Deltaproteobacteria bacterium]|nr:UbiD family decarboxylase [Deltaproteobacteria bacterium]MBI2182615.1 UbiD family decarboxylase [Deltaproteobacteria bacterium]MBI2228281.1 UbiD family decarboxylase [Deltaproteobacteria bacterium]MBI2365217.1 UbiD family decarboxylase [Deltaproteobacteria bacterium]MBI3065335.1 UbiD family decarboxylase [Deltaproteobacteria bacterium]